jgi:hypothetical protein
MAFDIISVAWEFLQVLASSSINLLTYGFCFWLLASVLFENLHQLPSMLCESFCKILHQPSMLLPLLVCQVFTSFVLIKCKCFQPLC